MKATRMSLLAMVFTGLTAVPALAEKGSDRAGVVNFLKQHVVGKTVSVTITEKIADGAIETEFSRSTSFVNFGETHSGFTFDMIFIIKQTNYDLRDGKRVMPGRKEDRVLVERYCVSERKSSGKLVGFSHVISNTFPDDEASADAIRIGLEGDKLVLEESSVVYNDLFAGEGQYKPGAVEVRSEFSVVEGKLHRTSTTKVFDVDPETLARKQRAGKAEVLQDDEVDTGVRSDSLSQRGAESRAPSGESRAEAAAGHTVGTFSGPQEGHAVRPPAAHDPRRPAGTDYTFNTHSASIVEHSAEPSAPRGDHLAVVRSGDAQNQPGPATGQAAELHHLDGTGQRSGTTAGTANVDAGVRTTAAADEHTTVVGVSGKSNRSSESVAQNSTATAPVRPAAEGDGRHEGHPISRHQAERLLKLDNDTSEPIEVWLQYFSEGKWYPDQPGPSGGYLVFRLAPGEDAYAVDGMRNNRQIDASRIRIRAQAGAKVWDRDWTREVHLVEPNESGERVYESDHLGTHTHKFTSK